MSIGLRAPLALAFAATASAALLSQSRENVPLQAGVSVQLPVTSNAVAVPRADQQDALVVALTADGGTYLGINRLTTAVLVASVKNALSTRRDKTLYLKADGRVPYARIVEVMDALRTSGADGLTFLTAQQKTAREASTPIPPRGLRMRVVN